MSTVQNQVQQLQQKATDVAGQVQQQVQQKASEVAESMQNMQQKATAVAGQMQERASAVAIDGRRVAQDKYAKLAEQMAVVMEHFKASVASLQEVASQKLGEASEAYEQAKKHAGVMGEQAKAVFDQYAQAADELYKNQVPEKTRNQISAAVQRVKDVLDMLLKALDEAFVAVKAKSERLFIEAVNQLHAVTAPLQKTTLSLTSAYVVPVLDKYAPDGKLKMEEGYAALTGDEGATQRISTFATCMLQASIILAKTAAATGCDLVTDMTSSEPKKSVEDMPVVQNATKAVKGRANGNHRGQNVNQNDDDSSGSSGAPATS